MSRLANKDLSVLFFQFVLPVPVFQELQSLAPTTYQVIGGTHSARITAQAVLNSWYKRNNQILSTTTIPVLKLPAPHTCLRFGVPKQVWEAVAEAGATYGVSPNIMARFIITTWAEKRIAKREET